MLLEKVTAAEAQMKAKLEEARASFAHKGVKGDHAEAALRFFLRQYLLRRFAVGHGEVIDQHERRSKQTDIVIANEDHPLTFTEEEPGLFFVEGICAGGEVKSVLTSEQLQTTLNNSRIWKQLEINPGKGTMIHANPEDRDRFYRSPPFFLFAYESQLSLESIRSILTKAGRYSADPAKQQLDAVFVLERGSLIDYGTGQGSMQFVLDGNSESGWQGGPSTTVLFDTLQWLTVAMPRMVRFEPILASYMFKPTQRKV